MVLAVLVVILIPLTLGIWLLNLAVYVLYSGSGQHLQFCIFLRHHDIIIIYNVRMATSVQCSPVQIPIKTWDMLFIVLIKISTGKELVT